MMYWFLPVIISNALLPLVDVALDAKANRDRFRRFHPHEPAGRAGFFRSVVSAAVGSSLI
jgi:hypothetical protein